MDFAVPKVVDHSQRRRELVDASWDVIVEQGIEGLTLRNVAKAAHCSTGRISHYFENRQDLLSAALVAVHKSAAARMNAVTEGPQPPSDRLRRIAHEALPLDDHRLREWKVWLVFWAAATTYQHLAEINRQRYEEWRGLVRRSTAELTREEETDLRTDELISLIDGLGLRITLDPSRANRQMAVLLIDRWFEGLLRD